MNHNENIAVQNTGLLKSLDLLNKENRDLLFDHYDNNHRYEKLLTVLKQSVEVIKQWHNAGAVRYKSKEVIEEIWHLYYENAPEMREIREALKEEVNETMSTR